MTKPIPFPGGDARAGERLRQAAAEKARAQRIRTRAGLGFLAVVLLAIPAWLDYAYFWPLSARYAAEFAWIVLLVILTWAVIKRGRRIDSAKAMALELERERPEVRCEISTAADYAARPARQPLHAELISGLHQRADFHLRQFGTPYRRHATAWLTVLAVGAGCLLVFLATVPAARLALERILLPWRVPYYTLVNVHPGKTEIAAESDLDIAAKFGGRLPAQSRIEWRSGDGPWQTAAMTSKARDAAVYELKNVGANFSYRVAANDAVSPAYRVAVYRAPAIATWQIDVVAPAYAHLPPQQSTTGEVTALRGAELRWRIVPTQPLTQARLHFEGGPPDLDLQKGGDGAWTGGMTLKADAVYRPLLVNADQHSNRSPSRFHLVAVPDAPPQVEITSPEVEIAADPGDKIPITVEANDDIGLASLDLISRQPGLPPMVLSLFPAGKSLRHLTVTQVLDLAPLQLKPYDVLIYHAEARDNNTYDGPGLGRSRAHFIVIRGPGQAKEPPPPPPSSGGGSSQKINLTQLQRDLISATTRLADNAPRDAMQDLATAQHQVHSYAAKAGALLTAAHADPAATQAMNSALDAMSHAENSLNTGDRPTALDQEALALAGLFQVSRFVPDADSPKPGSSPSLTFQLDDPAAREAKRQETQKQLSQALAQAKALQQAQQALQSQGQEKAPDGGKEPGKDDKGASEMASANPNTADGKADGKEGEKGSSNAPSPNQDQGTGAGKEGKADSAEASSPHQGTGAGIGKDDGKGASEVNAQNQGQGTGGDKTDATGLGKEQQALADQARQLANMLSNAAGSDPTVSHRLGQSAGAAADQMEVAAQELLHGRFYNRAKVSIAQRHSMDALDDLTIVLKNTLAISDRGTAVEDESVPPDYADQLAHYFQKLSHEK